MTPPRNNKPQSGTKKQHPKAPKGGSKQGGGKKGK